MFGHDKGQSSAISGRRLHWFFFYFLSLFSSGFFPFSPGYCVCNLRKLPQNVEKIARYPGGEKSVGSCHVSGCHDFGPDKGPFRANLFSALPSSRDPLHPFIFVFELITVTFTSPLHLINLWELFWGRCNRGRGARYWAVCVLLADSS